MSSSEDTKLNVIKNPKLVEIKIENVNDTMKLDYLSHTQTLNDFEKLYSNIYIHNNLAGKWEIK
jgi:hypothetical protein